MNIINRVWSCRRYFFFSFPPSSILIGERRTTFDDNIISFLSKETNKGSIILLFLPFRIFLGQSNSWKMEENHWTINFIHVPTTFRNFLYR